VISVLSPIELWVMGNASLWPRGSSELYAHCWICGRTECALELLQIISNSFMNLRNVGALQDSQTDRELHYADP